MNNIDINALWESTSALPPEQRGSAFQTLLNTQVKPTDSAFETKLMDIFEKRMDPEFRRKELEDKLEFDRRSIAEAGKYKALFGLPGQIISAYSVPSQIRAQGAANIAQMMQDTTSRIPGLMDFQPVAVNYSPRSYFG